MRVHFLVNGYRADAVETAREAAVWLSEQGVAVGAEPDVALRLQLTSVPVDQLAQGDLLVSFGGDGTLLRAAHLAVATGVPILGVYFGRFGFVTQVYPDEVQPALAAFLAGTALYDDRMMIQTDLMRDGAVVASLHSLNEAAVQRSATTRMLTFDVRVDGHPIARYPADGVLVSTPTGSTAYNLSAGGPIIDPEVRAMVVTAIMPHTLFARPLVLPEMAVVDIQVDTRGDAVLSCDGQSRLHLLNGDSIQVRRSPKVARLVAFRQDDFLSKLSGKLLSGPEDAD